MFNTPTAIEDDDLKVELRRGSKKDFTDEHLKFVDQLCTEEGFDHELFKSQMVSFTDALKGNKRAKPIDYIKAIQYCTYISMNNSQVNAYKKTFPDRVASKKTEGTVRASASIYHRTDLVQSIIKTSQVPMHLMFMSERYRAVEKLVNLMNDPDASHRIQMESADKLLSHIKPPEESKLTLDVNVNNEAIQSLDAKLEALAGAYLDRVEKGKITAQDIVDADLA